MGLIAVGISFVGPLVVMPEANQGPLLGLFAGPSGFALGAILGICFPGLCHRVKSWAPDGGRLVRVGKEKLIGSYGLVWCGSEGNFHLSRPEQIKEIPNLPPRVFLGEATAHDSSVADRSSGV